MEEVYSAPFLLKMKINFIFTCGLSKQPVALTAGLFKPGTNDSDFGQGDFLSKGSSRHEPLVHRALIQPPDPQNSPMPVVTPGSLSPPARRRP